MSLETEVNAVYRPLFEAATTPEQIDKIGGAWYSVAVDYAVTHGWPDFSVEMLRDAMRDKIKRAKADLASRSLQAPLPDGPLAFPPTPVSRQEGADTDGGAWGIALLGFGVTIAAGGLLWTLRRLSGRPGVRMGTLRYDIIPE